MTRMQPAYPRIRSYSPRLRQFARELRSRSTHPEAQLWEQLRKRRLQGWRFRRQQPIGNYIADFYCHEAKLVVELDGGYHANPEQQARDLERDAYMGNLGITVLRFWNREVYEGLPAVLESIAVTLRRGMPTP
jgi:very-short-patch-repair endonuclease